MAEEFMKIDEVAAELRVSRATVDNLIRSGKLAAVRVGRLIRVPRRAFEAFLESEMVVVAE